MKFSFTFLAALGVCLLQVARSNVSNTKSGMPLIVLDSAEATERGAVCLDGSPPGMYFRKAAAEEDKNKWVMYLHGGGWCYNEKDCATRYYTDLGSSHRFPKVMGYGGPVGPQATLNPTFATWNHVILMYCDGASFSGDRADTVPWADPQNPGKNISLHFRGRRILDFILDTLSEKYGMRTATEVLLSGGSAGGLAAYLHADYVEEYVNALNMKHGNPALSKYGVAPVSGFFLMHATGGEKEIPLYPNEMEYVFKMQNSSSGVNSKCLASYAGSPEHGYRCIFANESYAHSSAPIFPLQSAVDKWQLENIYDYDENCWGDITMDKCSAAQIERLNGYAHDLLTDISRTEKFKSAGSGAFIESCVEHVQMQGRGFNVYKIGGVSAQEALTSWWESDFQEPASKHTHLPCKLVENPLPGHSHICNPTCVSSSSISAAPQVYNFGLCYANVVENNRTFATDVYARVYVSNHSLEWWPSLNPNALNYDNKTTDNIVVECGPTGDFMYACRIDKVTCSTDLETVYAMCNAGNVFKGCVNHTGVALN